MTIHPKQLRKMNRKANKIFYASMQKGKFGLAAKSMGLNLSINAQNAKYEQKNKEYTQVTSLSGVWETPESAIYNSAPAYINGVLQVTWVYVSKKMLCQIKYLSNLSFAKNL